MKENGFVLFDHQAFEMQKFGGISRYFYELLEKLPLEARLSLRATTNYYLQGTAYPGVHFPERLYKWLKGGIKKWNRAGSESLLRRGEFDLFHPTYYDPYFRSALPEGKPYVVTVHDMNHELFPHFFGNAEKMIAWKKETISHASRIIAISERTKADLIRFLHVDAAKVDVIYHGIRQERTAYHGLQLPERYLLYVGDRHGYKNFARFLAVFARLAAEDKKLHLFCTGKPWKKTEGQQIHAWGLEDRVRLIRATDLELGQLFRQALCFVYPSLYEGFGIPVLEAWLNGCPVALSRASCFPEVAGEAGEYFNPEDEEEMHAVLSRLLADGERRRELVALGSRRVRLFTWEETARKTAETYRRCLEQNG